MCSVEMKLRDLGENVGSNLSSGVSLRACLHPSIYSGRMGAGTRPLPWLLLSFYLCDSRQMEHDCVLDIRRISLFGFLLFSLVYRKDK